MRFKNALFYKSIRRLTQTIKTESPNLLSQNNSSLQGLIKIADSWPKDVYRPDLDFGIELKRFVEVSSNNVKTEEHRKKLVEDLKVLEKGLKKVLTDEFKKKYKLDGKLTRPYLNETYYERIMKSIEKDKIKSNPKGKFSRFMGYLQTWK